MTEYYKPQETDLREIIYKNAVNAFSDLKGNFVFENFNVATSLFALCLIEFYGVNRNQIFYKNDHRVYDIEHKQVNLDQLSIEVKSSMTNSNRLQSLLDSDEFQDYLTDYLDCDKVELIVNYEGHEVYTLNVKVINIYDGVETVPYSETYEFTFTKQGLVTNLLHRFDLEDYEGSRLHALTLGDKIHDYLNSHLN